MKTTQTRFRSFVMAIAAVSLVACGGGNGNNNSGSEGGDEPDGYELTDDFIDVALNDEYAGFKETDEEPDFGDVTIASAPDLNEEADAPEDTAEEQDLEAIDGDGLLSDDPTVEVDGVRATRILVAVSWGHMLRPAGATSDDATDPADAPEREVLNMSGTLSVANGALRIKRRLAFEDNDYIVRPRTSIREVEFVSHTLPATDGLLVEVIAHPRLGTGPDSPPVLTLNTASFEGSLEIAPGMRLSKVVRIDDTGNGVAYHVFRPTQDGDDCREGMVVGRWIKTRETEDGRPLGKFMGRYIAADGTTGGKVKGYWGKRINGSNVFFGKVINREGAFVGTLAGKARAGKLRGRFLGKERRVRGVIHGMYRHAPEADGGLFRARYSQLCGELPTEGEIDANDEANDEVDATLPPEEDSAE